MPTRLPDPTREPATDGATKSDILTLRWWTPEFLSPQASQPTGPILAEQLNKFSEAQGGKVQVNAVLKARYGKGGLLDALRTAAPVAKDVLPDIVALDAAEVEAAVAAGVLRPLDALLGAEVTEGLYPFASEVGRFDGRLYAVQYIADVEHAAYLPAQLAEPPANWTDLIARGVTYLFPLASQQAGSSQISSAQPDESLSHAVLSQYLSAGATLGPDRSLALEQVPLLRLLTFYSDAARAGVLPDAARTFMDGDAVWQAFSQGEAPLAYVSARRFTSSGDASVPHTAAPGYQGLAPTLTSGWTLAIATTDPRRQRAAADLIVWLLQPENAGAWTARAGWLPTSPGALIAAGEGPYWSFLDSQLAEARSLPVGPAYATVAARMLIAIQAVLQGESTPTAATEAAIKGP